MSSRERPHPLDSAESEPRAQTGLRSLNDGPTSASMGQTGRSGEYRAIRPAASGADDRLTPTEPITTAGKPLPTLQRPATTLPDVRPRALSNPALERPYASLPPPSKRGTDPRGAAEPLSNAADSRRTTDPQEATDDPRRGTDPARPRSEPPPSMRRTYSAGPQRKLGTCQVHRVTLSPSGDCVFCRREAEKYSKARWSTITLLIILAVAVTVGLVLAQ